MAAKKRTAPKRFAIRLACSVAPARKPRRAYLVCGPDGPVAAVPGGNTGEQALSAAGFAKCEVKWDLSVPYEAIRVALALLPNMAKRGVT